MRRILSLLLQVAGILLLGSFVRYRRGPSMLDPFFFIPFACLSAILVGPILIHLHVGQADSLPGVESARPARFKHLRHAVARACAWMSLVLVVSLVSLNVPTQGAWLLPDWSTIFGAALLSITATIGMAAVMALLLARLPAMAAKWVFRGLAVCAILLYWKAPDQWSEYGMEAVVSYGVFTVAFGLAVALALLDAGLLHLLRTLPTGDLR